MSKKKKQLRSFTVTFESHRLPNKYYDDPITIVEVGVNASSVQDAILVASRQALRKFIDRVPTWVANVCWKKDHYVEGCGYIAGQAPRNRGKLSAPYNLTRRLTATVTLGNIPVQLELDFQ
ncbi:hypothetical protein D3C75_704990 [compost metagenome]